MVSNGILHSKDRKVSTLSWFVKGSNENNRNIPAHQHQDKFRYKARQHRGKDGKLREPFLLTVRGETMCAVRVSVSYFTCDTVMKFSVKPCRTVNVLCDDLIGN